MGADEKPRTVFGAPDQEDMIARIENAEAGDTSVSYIDEERDEVLADARRTFEQGVQTFSGASAAAQPLSGPPSPPVEAPTSVRGTADAARRATPVVKPLTDPAAQAAFILGGPAALTR